MNGWGFLLDGPLPLAASLRFCAAGMLAREGPVGLTPETWFRFYRRGAQPPVTVSEILRPGDRVSRSPPAGAYATVGVGPLSGEMPRMS
jgi:hypothetical protein